MTPKITPSDFDFIYGLYMHPSINPFLLYEPMDEVAFQPIFEQLLKDEILYIFQENGQNIGMFKLIRLTHRSDHIAYLGSVGIHPDFAGKGFGKKMMEAIIALGQEIGLLRIELSVSTANLKAQYLYKSVGFEAEGVLRKYTHLKSEGRFLDEMMMSYLY